MNKPPDITTAFSEELAAIVKANRQVIVVDADLADSCMTEGVGRTFPGQAVDLGVAEQSLPTFSAGLALMGHVPIYNTFAVFATGRGFDMLRVSVAYTKANVKIIGHAAGLSLGYAGPTHHALEDLALMRSLPGMTVLVPADGVECRQMMRWLVQHEGPVYLRLSRAAVPNVHAGDWRFRPGVPEVLAEGDEVVIFSTGDVCLIALEAREKLRDSGISARVVNVSSLKPLETRLIRDLARGMRGAVTIEDHNVIGGLGSVVAEAFSEERGLPPLRRMGVPDRFAESDECAVLREHYGLAVADVCAAVEELVVYTGSNNNR